MTLTLLAGTMSMTTGLAPWVTVMLATWAVVLATATA
jgi:hypothetical protein